MDKLRVRLIVAVFGLLPVHARPQVAGISGAPALETVAVKRAPAQNAPALATGKPVTLPAPSAYPDMTTLAGFSYGRPDLTDEQLRIAFALYHQKSEEDRQRNLALIRQAKDSLAFSIPRQDEVSPLSQAAARGDPEMVAAILAKGVPVDIAFSRDSYPGPTPLMSAIVYSLQSTPARVRQHPDVYGLRSPEKTLETITLLIKAGAALQARERSGQTPLALALWLTPEDADGEKLRWDIMKILYDSGALPARSRHSGGKAFKEDMEIATMLLKQGMSMDTADSRALALAVHLNRLDIARLLLARGTDPNVPAFQARRSALADATLMGRYEIAKVLLQAGAAANGCSETDDGGKCTGDSKPLLLLARHNPELFRFLLEKGADPNGRDADGRTILGSILAEGSPQIALLGSMPLLSDPPIRKICNVANNKCIDAPPPPDKEALVQILLEAGADPNRLSANFHPLLLLGDKEHALRARLLDKGARLQSGSIDGESIGPVSQAIVAGKPNLAAELLSRETKVAGNEEKWALYAATQQGNQVLAENLIRKGVDPNERGPFGEAALHYAAARQDVAMVRKLLSLGADPNVQTEKSLVRIPAIPNPLFSLAARYEKKEKLYTALGLQPPILGDGGASPLMLAANSGNLELAKVLLDAGAKTSPRSDIGLTALDVARMQGNAEMVKLLGGK